MFLIGKIRSKPASPYWSNNNSLAQEKAKAGFQEIQASLFSKKCVPHITKGINPVPLRWKQMFSYNNCSPN